MDIGSGAGFPALPLKIVFPRFRLVLLEATGKKAAFLSHVTAELGMDRVEIIHGRAEDLAHNTAYREKFDVVLARAVAELPSLAELSLPFCKPVGIVISPKKNDISPELREANQAVDLLGGKIREPVKVEIPGLGDERCLVVIDKIMETPLSFPRRSGIPQKRPIK
jgi:16S rRNA (guanine527-N7)-methyltransferase